jgi:hypothetical protein
MMGGIPDDPREPLRPLGFLLPSGPTETGRVPMHLRHPARNFGRS